MIARLRILLPFVLHLTEDFKETTITKTFEDYTLVYFPPYQASMKYQDIESDLQFKPSSIVEILKPNKPPKHLEHRLVNEKKIREVNAVQIYFKKDTFDRSAVVKPSDEYFDPSLDTIKTVVDEYIGILRSLNKNAEMKPFDRVRCAFAIEYFDNEMQELERTPDQLRGRYKVTKSFSYSVLTQNLWDEFSTRLNTSTKIKPWLSLYLDAKSMINDSGPCIVLLQTSLEVMIQTVLDKLSTEKNINKELWLWLNSRKDYWRSPSLAEKFNEILKMFSGKSLKEEQDLWAGFSKIKKYRNGFIHSGDLCKSNNEPGFHELNEMIECTRNILEWLDQFLDEKDRFPLVKETLHYETDLKG